MRRAGEGVGVGAGAGGSMAIPADDGAAVAPFKDYFSRQAAEYAGYRPTYPAELFAWLAAEAPSRDAAWDVGTGSGQAAVGLAEHFARVEATDPSATQLAHAVPHERIRYRQARGEDSGLADTSASVVTIAQALHWLDLPAFWREVRRVLRPRGIVAAWGYDLVRVSPEVDAVVDHFYGVTLRDYWASERRLVDDHYRSVAFPFTELEPPPFAMRAMWPRERLVGYLRTWSAVRTYLEREGRDPVADIEPAIAAAWPGGEPRTVRWSIFIRAGRVAG
ncbi:MAG TPA: class I SAM-dependent methyltransferase [Gemmatimonadaceae bacterium]